jgi:hypothetical protein
MDKQHDDPMVTMTLELPANLVTKLEEIRRQFGEEVVTDLVIKAYKTVEGRLALRGAFIDKNRK